MVHARNLPQIADIGMRAGGAQSCYLSFFNKESVQTHVEPLHLYAGYCDCELILYIYSYSSI